MKFGRPYVHSIEQYLVSAGIPIKGLPQALHLLSITEILTVNL
ncbi:hypothetical protein NUZ5A_20660 [Candidatus Nitrosotenuis uzonensis]|uniref:Uncharacterized protein n=1 Tax=Candidatus Nitrosotenuis uzonensis TaxID=1407055 RepID=A0A812F0M3_9ARCH|nr:hypothetical protein NUZ5A_20660 [Candidatus Nitrosotenuis uzonensis]